MTWKTLAIHFRSHATALLLQGELLDLPVDEAMFRAKHVASHMENLGVCTLRCLPDGKVWSKDSFYTIGAELCWAALQRWYSPREEEQVNEMSIRRFTTILNILIHLRISCCGMYSLALSSG